MQRLKNLWASYRPHLFLIGLAAVSAFSIYLGFTYFIELSLFSVVLTMFSCVLILGVLVDRYILEGIDTLTEIKKGNNAVAITLLALAVLFLACAQLL